MTRSPFVVDVSDLLGRDVPPRPVVVEAVVDWRLEMSRILPDPPLVADLSVAAIPGGILVRGEVCFSVEHTCRRCLTEFVDDGKLTPIIDRRYSLGETPAAMGYVATGHARGKAVIVI